MTSRPYSPRVASPSSKPNGWFGSQAARQQFANRSMWATTSERLPVIQVKISESLHLEWLLSPTAVVQTPRKTILRRTGVGRVEMWRGGVRSGLSVAAPFVWRCPSNLTLTPFPHPAHRTGHADFPHPALGQDITFSLTTRHAQAASDVRVRSTRRDATDS